jgi:predicted nucleic acid-binding protein
VTDADPTRVVADADVLAADLFVGGGAREALDCVREHSWMTLVASDSLLAETGAVVASLGDEALAEDWRDRIEAERVRVEHPPDDHPGLASAYRGRAAHLLTLDEGLASAGANLSLQPHMQLSVRTPGAFARLFDPAALYEATRDGAYPGPDRDPRG